MVPDVTAPLERFHNVLVDEIRRQRPDYLRESFPLSEIYQRLVPYRSHRDALGLDMNGDYEDVLLRLLAGAGDLVILESPEARDQIRRELDSKNPNTGLFREFAAAEVHLNVPSGSAVDADADGATETPPTIDDPAAGRPTISDPAPPATVEATSVEPAGDSTDPVEVVDTSPKGGSNGTYFDFETTALDPVELAPATPAAARAATSGDGAEEAPAESRDESTEGDSSRPTPIAGIWKPGHPTKETVTKMSQDDCGWCGDPLPHRADVNFCPFCGKTTKLKPCPDCGDEMDLQWRFCVRCGTEASAGVAAAT